MGTMNSADVRRAAGHMENLSDVLAIWAPTGIKDVGEAMPQSRAAASAQALSELWASTYRGLGGRIDSYAEALRDTAEAWDNTDEHQRRRLERLDEVSRW